MSWIVPVGIALVLAGLLGLAVLAARVYGEVRALNRAVAGAGHRLEDALAELDGAMAGASRAGARDARGKRSPVTGVPSSVTPG